MASRSGMFLGEAERNRLIKTLQPFLGNDTGCLICEKDDDHDNLLLCDNCESEYHTYCLDPPLPAVPNDDWYCDKCSGKTAKPQLPLKTTDDGLAGMVTALPREFTERFGEVVFCNGGIGFGWWPSVIFDPRLTEGSARQTAKKNLGKKHLIYFFECHEAPFAVLSNSKIVNWTEGLADNYHLGKTARASGKHRALQFQQALQAAILEEDKPLEMRLDWNRSDEHQPQLLPVPKQQQQPARKNNKNSKDDNDNLDEHLSSPKRAKKGRRGGEEFGNSDDVKRKHKKTTTTEEDGPLFCRVLKRSLNKTNRDKHRDEVEDNDRKKGEKENKEKDNNKGKKDNEDNNKDKEKEKDDTKDTDKDNTKEKDKGNNKDNEEDKENPDCDGDKIDNASGSELNIGFVKLPSMEKSTFADARKAIQRDLIPDALPRGVTWRFHISTLGPVSLKQELSLGPLIPFLRSGIGGNITNGGTVEDPITVLIFEPGEDDK